MSPELIRMFFVAGVSVLLGGFVGAYTTRSIYGTSTADVRPVIAHDKPCPACAECPVCPPPPDCGEHGVVPTSSASRAAFSPETEEGEPERRAGLPASAVVAATQRVQAAVAPCVAEAQKTHAQGIVLLALTVTATGTQAFISEVNIERQTGATPLSQELERCLVDQAHQARFDWHDTEGEAHFRLPIKLTP